MKVCDYAKIWQLWSVRSKGNKQTKLTNLRHPVYLYISKSFREMHLRVFLPAGEAWVTLVVVTIPVFLPCCWKSLTIESTWFFTSTIDEQFFLLTAAVTPIVPKLDFTPPRYAVAEQAESGVWWSTQYV